MFFVLVGARTSDDTKETNVPCHSQKLNHNKYDKIIYFCT